MLPHQEAAKNLANLTCSQCIGHVGDQVTTLLSEIGLTNDDVMKMAT